MFAVVWYVTNNYASGSSVLITTVFY